MKKRPSTPGIGIEKLLFLASMGLFLATVELMIPKPMPFLKLGIANLPLLLFIRQLRFREVFWLSLLKILCQGIIAGTLLSYIVVFSACASLASALGMWVLGKIPPKVLSLLGISLAGAAVSNAVQLWLALIYFFPGTGSLLIPWSLSFGLGSGFLLGMFALRFTVISKWYQAFLQGWKHLEQRVPFHQSPIETATKARLSVTLWKKPAIQRFLMGLLGLALVFYLGDPLYLFLHLVLFSTMNYWIGHPPWWRSMLFLGLVLIFFHLLLPTGRILWELSWPGVFELQITQGALLRGLEKWFFLLNLIQVSRFAISKELHLPGKLGHYIQKVFYVYELFLNSRVKMNPLQLAESLEQTLLSVETAQQEEGYASDKKQPSKPISMVLFLIFLISEVFLLLSSTSFY